MSDHAEMNETTENAGIAQVLAGLTEKHRSLAVDLEALARLVETEIAAAQTREVGHAARLGEALDELAEATAAVEIEKQKRIEAQEQEAGHVARLGETLGELAEAKAAVEIERQKRVEAEERAAGIAGAIGVIEGALANLRSVSSGAQKFLSPEDPNTPGRNGGADGVLGADATAAVITGVKRDEEGIQLNGAGQGFCLTIVVDLTPAEAATLDAIAARADGDRNAAATRLLREGLRCAASRPEPRPLE